jgi:hypothetical protein
MLFKITTSKYTYYQEDADQIEALKRLGFNFAATAIGAFGEGLSLKPDFIEKEISSLDDLMQLVLDLGEEVIVGKGTLRIFNWYES